MRKRVKGKCRTEKWYVSKREGQNRYTTVKNIKNNHIGQREKYIKIKFSFNLTLMCSFKPILIRISSSIEQQTILPDTTNKFVPQHL